MFESATWNKLGLGVAATYLALGAAWQFAPPFTDAAAVDTPAPSSTHPSFKNPSTRDMISLVAIRDVCFAIATFTLAYRGVKSGNEAAGVVILSSMPLCLVDVGMLWKWNRRAEALGATVGVGIWSSIGVGLLRFT